MIEKALALDIGQTVRIERDETRYPSKGSWPEFRGRTGTVVEINLDRKRPNLTEYGVAFGKVTAASPQARRATRWDHAAVAWFKVYEICALATQRHAERSPKTPDGYYAEEAA
ncbi:hypothetical protein [Mycobacterium sp. 852002-51057_SCH5723018]|uniref:hypothetical protein n=1 Tax=Mycobacterium sp. 852002-51057_SCH5723018 TaxID=1834094 RepID=UPI0007FD0BE7|nr:hypothetical protein [Mycobacterium sp. 852002-51057_SCH5723018]OBG28384.1 hypothetical protein A5764_25720 [Mycobacterium sp. 852002-51057_SCH5723018]